MKYAFIALIVCYLVIYGCGPDNSDNGPESHEQTAPVHQQEPAAPTHEEQQQPVKSIQPTVAHEEPAAEVAEQPAEQHVEAVAVETAEQAQPAAEEKPAAPVVERRVIMEQQSVTKEQQATEVAESEQVVMPCGRTMARADIPENAPCLETKPQGVKDTAGTAGSGQELTTAMQKMVETTNEMVLATRQLTLATQKMLNAGKGVAVEVIDTGKEAMEAQQETEPVEQSVEGQDPAATPEKDVVETMQAVLSAAKDVIEATNQAISTALEAEKK